MPVTQNIGVSATYMIVDETDKGSSDISIDQSDILTSQGKLNIGAVRAIGANVDAVPAGVNDIILYKTDRVRHFMQNGARFAIVDVADVILWNYVAAPP